MLITMGKVLVADIMTKDPITASPSSNLFECTKKMVRKHVGSVLLVEDKKLKGIITQRDILWALIKKGKKDLKEIKAIDISPKKIITIKPTATLEEAISKIKKSKFERLPVIHEGNLVGIVTVKDILRLHPNIYPELKELSKIREQTKKLKNLKKILKDKDFIKEGYCSQCGEKGPLFRFNNLLVCDSCRRAM